jgi:hypothetical protein
VDVLCYCAPNPIRDFIYTAAGSGAPKHYSIPHFQLPIATNLTSQGSGCATTKCFIEGTDSFIRTPSLSIPRGHLQNLRAISAVMASTRVTRSRSAQPGAPTIAPPPTRRPDRHKAADFDAQFTASSFDSSAKGVGPVTQRRMRPHKDQTPVPLGGLPTDIDKLRDSLSYRDFYGKDNNIDW